MEKNKYGRNTVKLMNGSQLFMRAVGSSPKGDLPFLNTFDINTKETKQLWRCEEPYYETVTDVLDYDKLIIVTSKQSQDQQHFMMAITHELKTPIAVSKLNLETMQKHKLDETRQQRLIQNTLQEANRLNDLCNNLLLSSQIEAGGTVSTPEEIDMASLLQKTVQDYMVRYPERIIESRLEDNVPVNGDPVLLQMAVSNLIENALKYSPKEKPVRLLLGKTEKNAVVQVIDEGPGIAEAEKKKLFDRFYRLGNEATKKAKGTGLGLYLVKKIIFTHKGQINLADNPSGGSIFALSLPLSEI